MCGIFGQISKNKINRKAINKLSLLSSRRGKDSSGLVFFSNNRYNITKSDTNISNVIKNIDDNYYKNSKLVIGHTRLITNSLNDNQPVVRNKICLLHNGIIINHEKIWKGLKLKRFYQIDSEIILGMLEEHFLKLGKIDDIYKVIKSKCEGTMSCAILVQEKGKLILFSNNGSLFIGYKGDDIFFASEKHILNKIKCHRIKQIFDRQIVIDIPKSKFEFVIDENKIKRTNLIPSVNIVKSEEKLLNTNKIELRRCSKCILPETMPYIKFDKNGICNYCNNYTIRNKPKPKTDLFEKLAPFYKINKNPKCIIPFSGGRDSSYALHLCVKELNLKPITYTYDWGMVTDLARRNISRMCSSLGIENIIVSADIEKKRKYIKKNLITWLKKPHLGMISLLTAGDKHFFKYIEKIKKETNVSLNIWGINPLEITHFKTGFLGLKPGFDESLVYKSGLSKQINYQFKRLKVMFTNLGYFNESLWDTYSGEYYRSFKKKSDYYHIFDYWTWEEDVINDTLLNSYNWEISPDTKSTWRIGDGTASFYNYIYYIVAGFTEHDTFRSNQIREGQISRNKALKLVYDENIPRYESIKWYLNTLNLDFTNCIKVINNIPKIYNH